MKIIDSITDKNEWLMYLQHKIDGENIRREERKKLERYIKEEKYTYLKDKITEGEFFSALPVKKMVNKEGSKKSRVVYSFEDEISIPLKFIAFKLHKYDNRLSDNCYSFRQGYGVKNAINKIKRNNKIKSMFCYKIDISNYFNSIDPDTLLDRISFLKEEDEEIYRLFRSMLLNNNVVVNGSIISENHGAMAGIPVSPFFANFYLAESDRKFQDALYFRYSDDIIIFAESEEELDKYRKILSEVIYESKLKFNYDKEIIANPLDKWEFLGFSYDDGITAAGTVISSICENGESFTLGSSSTYTYGSGQCTASGWSLNSGTDNTISSINGQSLTDGNTITLSGYSAGYILNLYAVWTPTNYTITFNIGTSDEGFSGNDVAVSQPYYTTYQLPQKVENDWEWTIGANYHLSNWLLEDVNIPLATKILITKNLTYQAGWLYAYRVPVITNITSERFLDADYETPNTGGKFLQIAAVGVNGGYDGATVLTHSYDVRARFYEQQPDTKAYILTEDEIAQTGKTYYEIIKDSITGQSTGMFEEVRNIPEGTNPKTQEWYELSGIQEIAFYPIPLNNLPSSDEFSQQWGSSERPIFDKKLQMLYCILDIIDTTKYCIEVQNKPEGINPQQQEWYEVIENKYVKTEDTEVDNEKTYYQEELNQESPARHFTYEFVVNLKRAIAIHVADDLSAVSMLQELEEGDSGLVIKGPMNLQRSWIWDVDPLNQILVLKWGGSNE